MKSILQTAGFTMHCAVFGQGPMAYVMLPGISLTHTTDFEQAVSARYAPLLERCTVYLLDRREELGKDTTIHGMAEDSYIAMQALGVRRAVVFGASQGGMLALDMAVHHPEFVSGLILSNTAPYNPASLQACSEKWLDMIRRKDSPALNASFLDWMFSERFLKANRQAALAGMGSYDDMQLERFACLVGALNTIDLPENWKSVRCPTLVIGAEGDRVMGVEASREIASALHSECILYGEGYGHAVYDEAPDFLDHISAFLDRIKA